LPYGSHWTSHRRLFQQGFNTNVVRDSCHPIQSEKMIRFLLNLLTTPDDFIHHTEMYVRFHLLLVLRAHTAPQANWFCDSEVSAATRSVRNLTTAMLPGQWLVYTIPSLHLLPEWLPRCYFQTFARETKVLTEQVIEGGYEEAVLSPVCELIFVFLGGYNARLTGE
ncbi:hypothetical protein BDV98DRAFT_631436, partial [Pterulicium gracile]